MSWLDGDVPLLLAGGGGPKLEYTYLCEPIRRREWRPEIEVKPDGVNARRTGKHVGQRNPNSVLTEEKVLLIRARAAAGKVNWTHLARELGVGRKAVIYAATGETWKHLT